MSMKNKEKQEKSPFQEQDQEMYVLKRTGRLEIMSFDKILKRIRTAGREANLSLNYTQLTMKIIDQLINKITTTKIDELTAEQCASMSSVHPDYNILAGRIIVSNHIKNTPNTFTEAMTLLYRYKDKNGVSAPLISKELYQITRANSVALNALCDIKRDYLIDYFGFKTLEKSYLMKINGKIVERPQYMWLRVAMGIHCCSGANKKVAPVAVAPAPPTTTPATPATATSYLSEYEDEIDMTVANSNANTNVPKKITQEQWDTMTQTYHYMSQKYFTHATPTLFNAGTPHPQLSSCYLISLEEDSIEGIYNTLKDCAKISKWAGGIGLHIHNLRGSGSHIRGTNGVSNGIVPMLRVFNQTAKYVDQGGGKRNGSIAVYLEPWHYDIERFLQLKKNHGEEDSRARDLFYALWIPDLFMKRVKANGKWTLMCPDECPRLADVYGDEFETLYTSYEEQGKGREVSARDIWKQITDSQQETGVPYMLYKDHVNRKSNQKNVGVIKSSNLCVAPNTRILTDRGHVEIQELHAQQQQQPVSVWNGHEFSPVEIMKTGENKKMMCVRTSDGGILECTPYHKFYAIKATDEIVMKDAQELMVGDRLLSCDFPVIHSLLEQNIKALNDLFYFNKKDVRVNEQNGDLVYIHHSLSAHQEERETKEIKELIQMCGASAHIIFQNKLSIANEDVERLCSVGLVLNKDIEMLLEAYRIRPKLTSPLPPSLIPLPSAHTKYVSVSALFISSKNSDTYCFNEPKRHMGVFNGILTGNCTEIMEYSDPDETACCNLASIALPAFVETNQDTNELFFNYEKLHEIAKIITHNLNKIIDINFYPTEKTKKSNFRHRPIGIGIQGLADIFMMFRISFTSDKARELNKHIFETIYHGALEMSMELAKTHGKYDTFVGSPASNGILQFDMWNVEPTDERYKWGELKQQIMEHGLRNSLLLAPMPTASTSQILGYNECIEPITSNIYSRGTSAGQFMLVNKYLINDLIKMGVWNVAIKNKIIENNGSVQHLTQLPQEMRDIYKTAWEISAIDLIHMSADRGAYICQSQSLNLWVEQPTDKELNRIHFEAWDKGLKTGMYYLRRRAKHQAQQFTIPPPPANTANTAQIDDDDEEEGCAMCSA